MTRIAGWNAGSQISSPKLVAGGLPQRSEDLRDNALQNDEAFFELRDRAFAGDDVAIEAIEFILPADRFTWNPYKPRHRLTRANLATALAKIGHPRARELLIDAWSHCHLTTIYSLGGIRSVSRVFDMVRPTDPHIPGLSDRITLWRGAGRAKRGAGGMSWTLDFKMAKWFATNYLPARGVADCVVFQREVRREYVLAVVGDDDGRDGEKEVLLRLAPWAKAKIVWSVE